MEKTKPAFLYAMLDGMLIVYTGYLFYTPRKGWAQFINKAKSQQCSAEAGTICNSVVWFYERNDDKARQMLIDHEDSEIQKYKLKILSHEKKLELLKISPLVEI